MYDGGIPFDEDYLEFAAPEPQELPKWLSLLKPMEPFMWLATGASILVMATIFFIFSRYLSKSWQNFMVMSGDEFQVRESNNRMRFQALDL